MLALLVHKLLTRSISFAAIRVNKKPSTMSYNLVAEFTIENENSNTSTVQYSTIKLNSVDTKMQIEPKSKW